MYTGSLPSTSIYGTWVENIEIWDLDTDTPLDLSSVTEITLKLRDPHCMIDTLTLKKSAGDIVIPAAGIVQWRAEAGVMGTLEPKLYDVVLLLQDATDTVPLVLGTVSVLGEGIAP